MFKIENTIEDEVDKICILNEVSGECVKIAPKYSGLINQLILRKDNLLYSILDGYTTKEEFEENPYFKGAIMSPFPNRLKDGKYTFEGREYNFPINDDLFSAAIHGFFYKRNMEECAKTVKKDYAELQLENVYGNEYEYYPFNFRTIVKYRLTTKGDFSCLTEIVNEGENSLPIGIGWHPYFQLGEKVNHLFLKIPEGRYNCLDERMIPTGDTYDESKFLESEIIGTHNFNTGLKLTKSEGIVFTEIHSVEKNIKINFWQECGDRKYSYLQLYIPPQRNSIAIEPMTCNVDAFNNSKGLTVLEQGEFLTTSFGINIR